MTSLKTRAIRKLAETHGLKMTKMVVDIGAESPKCCSGCKCCNKVPYLPVRRSNRELLRELARKGLI